MPHRQRLERQPNVRPHSSSSTPPKSRIVTSTSFLHWQASSGAVARLPSHTRCEVVIVEESSEAEMGNSRRDWEGQNQCLTQYHGCRRMSSWSNIAGAKVRTGWTWVATTGRFFWSMMSSVQARPETCKCFAMTSEPFRTRQSKMWMC